MPDALMGGKVPLNRIVKNTSRSTAITASVACNRNNRSSVSLCFILSIIAYFWLDVQLFLPFTPLIFGHTDAMGISPETLRRFGEQFPQKRVLEWAVLLLLVFVVLFRGGKSLESTWVLTGVAGIVTVLTWWQVRMRGMILRSIPCDV